MKTKQFKLRESKVVDDKIIGTQEDNKKLYMVVWERLANSGIMYVWARSEIDAFDLVGFSVKYVKHTIVEINPKSMPIEIGKEG